MCHLDRPRERTKMGNLDFAEVGSQLRSHKCTLSVNSLALAKGYDQGWSALTSYADVR